MKKRKITLGALGILIVTVIIIFVAKNRKKG